MKIEDVIRMAREAGGLNCDCCLPEPEPHEMQKFIERFAALVAAYERERIIAANAPEIEKVNEYIKALEGSIATVIRAREEK
jgi:hypothetical protein